MQVFLKRIFVFCSFGFLISINSVQVMAQYANQNQLKFVGVVFENDIFFQDDGGYTNGVGIAWGNGTFERFDSETTPWPISTVVKDLYINTRDGRHRAISYLFGQTMNTAEDITREELLEDQPPYAGLLAGRITLHAFNAVQTDRMSFLLGLVGPSSGAEKTQHLIHDVTGSEDPKGWDNQIHDELVFRFELNRSDRLWDTAFDNGIEMDFVSTKLAGAGTLSSDIGYGLGLRIGTKLLDSFPVATDLPGREVNPIAGTGSNHWTVFLNLFARYEFNDVLIEGNNFRDSHGVELIHEQGMLTFGFSFNMLNWALTFTNAISTELYEGQNEVARFGSINLTYKIK